MKVNAQERSINSVGMSVIILMSLGYILFGSSFAQLRLEFSFLNFPIFIGEILLLFVSLLLIAKSFQQKSWVFGPVVWITGVYILFVLYKALIGYHRWGPLAFRDAALFYYLLFVLFGYSFWSKDWEGEILRRLGLVLILLILILQQFNSFWPCSLIILGLILSLQAKNLWERVLMTGAVLLFAPYYALFNIFYRTVLLSSLITGIFIAGAFFLLCCKNFKIRIVTLVVVILSFCAVLFKFCHTDVGNTYLIRDTKPLANVVAQEPSRAKFLFHPVGSTPDKPDAIKGFFLRISRGHSLSTKQGAVDKDSDSRGMVKDDELGIKKNDTLFRYYIWRDMAQEYIQYKSLFGFDFGRPLRSRTIEHYGISSSEYKDGWVGAHNSFFNMIYRGGIVGLGVVLSVLFIWFRLLRDAYASRDWIGILLSAVLLNWFISANFFLIFELPYTAIPVWVIFGIALKYSTLKKTAAQG